MLANGSALPGYYCKKSKPKRFTENSLFLDRLNLYVDAGGEIELHQRVYRLLGRLEDIDQPLVRANLEGLARLLVDVGRAENAILVLHSR